MLTMMEENGPTLVDERKCQERRRRRKYRFRDRRSGFERRAGETKGGLIGRTLVALRDQPKRLLGLLIGVNLLNVADFWLTLIALDAGGREANPLLRSLFSLGPVWVGIFKVVAVSAATLLIWESRRYRKALAIALLVFLLLVVLMLYHVVVLALIANRS